MAEIASETSGKGVFQKDIATRQEISVKYLDSIIQELKTANLIVNAKGKKSGYVLTRDPKDITMMDIQNAFDNGIYLINCLVSEAQCDRAPDCNARKFWNNLNTIIIDYFKSITLQDIVDNNFVVLNRLDLPDVKFNC
jgi:Rrf2 family protein